VADRRKLRRKLIEAEVPIEPGTLGYWARLHLRSLEVRNYSPSTIHGRRKDLLYFLSWANERAITRPDEVTVAVLERYQRHMFYARDEKGKGLSFRVQQTRMIALRVYFRWLVRQHVVEMSPAELLELPRPEYRLPKQILSVADVESLLATCEIKSPVGLRDRAIMELLYSSGLRRFEVCTLKVWDVSTDERTVTVRQGKGKKDRIVPMGERAALWIRKYLDEARPELAMEPDSGYLFLTSFRVPLVPERVSEIVRAAGRAAGFERPLSAHVFRHTMATMMLEGGADIRFVQAMLGHAHLATTEIYTRVAIRKLKEVHAMSHPGAKLEIDRAAAAAIDEQTSIEMEKEKIFSSLVAEAAEEEGKV
jgi:integrase/recombinase XerD